MTEQEIIDAIIQSCNYNIQLVKENEEYFSDDFDYDMIEWFSRIRKLIMKLSKLKKNKTWN